MNVSIFSLILAFLTTAAFSLPFEVLYTAEIAGRMSTGSFVEEMTAFLPVLGERMFPQSILLFVLFIFLYRSMLKRVEKRHFSLAALLLGCLFTLYMLCGECALATGGLDDLVSNMPQCLITLIKTLGFLPLFYYAIKTGFAKLDERDNVPASSGLSGFIFERHPFIVPLCLILLCWLPWVIAFYPGFVPSDGLKQLNNFYGSGNFTDNHPAFSTMMMGWSMRLGRQLGSDNLGIFLFTGPQLLVNALAVAACFPLFQRLRTPRWLRWTTLLTFALLPMWPNYAYSMLKDSYYMALILLITVQTVWILLDANGFCGKWVNLILMTLELCLLMLTRHEGKFVVSILFLSLFTIKPARGQWKKLLPVLLIPLCVTMVFNDVVRPRLHIADSPAREALTMPMRQVAAVVMRDEGSISEEQSAVLHDLFVYDKIEPMFSVDNGDYLKGQFDPWASDERISAFMKVWAELGLTHPVLYFNVFMSCNTHYYYPFVGVYLDIYGWFGIEQADYVNKGLFDIHYMEGSEGLRQSLINIADGMPRLPLTSLFYSLGVNAWALLFLLAYLLRKKVHGLIVPLIPALFTFITLQNSAINGFFRYMLPMMITLPLCAAWTIWSSEQI